MPIFNHYAKAAVNFFLKLLRTTPFDHNTKLVPHYDNRIPGLNNEKMFCLKGIIFVSFMPYTKTVSVKQKDFYFTLTRLVYGIGYTRKVRLLFCLLQYSATQGNKVLMVLFHVPYVILLRFRLLAIVLRIPLPFV